MATFPTVNDRVVQYPGRVKLVPVAGASDTYDLRPVPGTVSAEGTNLDKTFFAGVKGYIDGFVPKDRVIDQGNVKIGTSQVNVIRWRKWESGMLEVWCRSNGNANCNQKWGSLWFQKGRVGKVPFPVGCPRFADGNGTIVTSSIHSTNSRLLLGMADFYLDRTPEYSLYSADRCNAYYNVMSYIQGYWK